MPPRRIPNKEGEKAHQLEIEIRRRNVAANLLGGLNYKQMADALGVSTGTIAGDVAAIIEEYKTETLSDVDEYIELEVARIDVAMNAIWAKVQAGNFQAIETMTLLQNQRAKYKPLQLATRLEIGVPGATVPQETLDQIREQRWNSVASKLARVIDVDAQEVDPAPELPQPAEQGAPVEDKGIAHEAAPGHPGHSAGSGARTASENLDVP